MNKEEIQIIKKEILHYLVDDFKNNSAIFNKEKGYQIYNETDLEMVMGKVVDGLYSAKDKTNTKLEEERNKRLKAIEYIKGLLDNTDDFECYGIDRHCKENLLMILGEEDERNTNN